MSGPLLNLSSLLSPITTGTFFTQHWEKQPLHVKRSRSDYYELLLTSAQLEALIGSPETRYPAVQLSRGGGYIPAEVFSESVKLGSDTFTGVVDIQKLNAEYRAGATVVMPALHRTWRPLGQLCAEIESELSHAVHANAYLTPGNTAGFTPHYDTHEVMVLQVSGTKHWRVFAPPIELPHRRQPFNPLGYTLPGKPMMEIDLEPGDLLYLPRGYVHTTTTSQSSSAHVTIGMTVYTWIDLAAELIPAAIAVPRFRKALPPGFARTADRGALAAELSAVITELLKGADAPGLVEAFVTRAKSKVSTGNVSFRADVVVVQPDTLLEAPNPQTYRVVPNGANVLLEFQDKRLLLLHAALQQLMSMRTKPVFRPAELPSTLDLESRLGLVRTLLDTGFLTLAGSTNRPPM